MFCLCWHFLSIIVQGPQQRHFVVFRFGSVSFFGLTRDEEEQWLGRLKKYRVAHMEQPSELGCSSGLDPVAAAGGGGSGGGSSSFFGVYQHPPQHQSGEMERPVSDGGFF